MTLLAEIALVALAGICVAACVALVPGSPPAPHQRRPSTPARPDQLVELERLVITAGTSAVHSHAYLRPRLIEIASHRLATHGETLERMNEAQGRELLGVQLWEIVRPGRPFPEDRYGRGIEAGELAAMLEVLERL